MKGSIKYLVFIVTTTFLAACGYDGGSFTPAPTPAPTPTTTLSGSAVKGVLANADVFACLATVTTCDATTALATTTSDASGNYSLAVPSDATGTVIIQLSSTADTTMKCDVTAGCGGGVAFGGSVAIPAGELTLRAVVADIAEALTDAGTVSINVTTLTEMATSLAQETAGAGVAITASVAETALRTTAVAVFGDVSVDVNKLPVVDITDPVAVAAVTDDTALQALFINAAILETGFSTAGSGSTISQAISTVTTSVVNQYATDGGLVPNSASATVIDFSDILAASATVSATVAAAVQASADVTDDQKAAVAEVVAAVDVATDAKKTEQDALPADTVIVITPPTETSGLAANKAFVDEFRDVLVALGENVIADDGRNFVEQLDAAEVIVNDSADILLDALGDAGEAIGEAIEAYAAGTNTTESFTSSENITVTNAGAVAGVVTFSVTSAQVSDGANTGTVSLVATATPAASTNTATLTSGTVTGSQTSSTMTVTGGTVTFTATSTTLADVAVSITDQTNTFSGTIDSVASGLNTTSTFTGSFSDGVSTTDDFSTVMSINLTDITGAESSTNFEDYTFNLSFTGGLSGLTGDTKVNLSGSRTDLTNSTATLKVTYESGKFLESTSNEVDAEELTNESSSLTVTDHQGTVLTGSVNATTDLFTGTITAGTDVANVVEGSAGHVVTFSDDTIETIE